MRACVRACVRARACVCVCVCMRMHTHVCVHACACAHELVQVCVDSVLVLCVDSVLVLCFVMGYVLQSGETAHTKVHYYNTHIDVHTSCAHRNGLPRFLKRPV